MGYPVPDGALSRGIEAYGASSADGRPAPSRSPSAPLDAHSAAQGIVTYGAASNSNSRDGRAPACLARDRVRDLGLGAPDALGAGRIPLRLSDRGRMARRARVPALGVRRGWRSGWRRSSRFGPPASRPRQSPREWREGLDRHRQRPSRPDLPSHHRAPSAPGRRGRVTARDRTFVPDLLGRRHPAHDHRTRPAQRHAAKVTALARRSAELAPATPRSAASTWRWGTGRARFLPRLASPASPISMFDYEHVSTWMFRHFCDRILIPRAVAGRDRRPQPARPVARVRRIQGGDLPRRFPPTRRSRKLEIADEEVLAVVRPPSRTAHYHDAASEAILDAVARRIGLGKGVRGVWLRRDAASRCPIPPAPPTY